MLAESPLNWLSRDGRMNFLCTHVLKRGVCHTFLGFGCVSLLRKRLESMCVLAEKKKPPKPAEPAKPEGFKSQALTYWEVSK